MNTKRLPSKVLIADLQSKIKEIESEKNSAQFFSKVALYGKYLATNDALNQILKFLPEESAQDEQPYRLIFQIFIDKWQPLAKDILKKAKLVGITDDPNSSMPGYIATITEKLKLGSTEVDLYMGPYRRLVWKFNDLGKSKSLTPKHFELPEGVLKIEPEYQDASREWSKFEQIRETSVWWAHYKLQVLSASIFDLETVTPYFGQSDFVNRFYRWEFNEIVAGNTPDTPILLVRDYGLWVRRLHDYLIPRLENEAELNELVGTNNLENCIPLNRRNRYIRKMAVLLSHGEVVSNFSLSRCIYSSLTQKKYSVSPKVYNQEVQNRLRTIKKYWKKERCDVKAVPGGYMKIPLS